MNLIEELGLEKCQAIVHGAPDWATTYCTAYAAYGATFHWYGACKNEIRFGRGVPIDEWNAVPIQECWVEPVRNPAAQSDANVVAAIIRGRRLSQKDCRHRAEQVGDGYAVLAQGSPIS